MLDQAIDEAKLPVKPSYAPAEVEKIAGALSVRKDRIEQVCAYLRIEIQQNASAPTAPPVAAAPAPSPTKK